MEILQEKELVQLIRESNVPAYEKIYQLYSIRILKKLIRLLKDEEMAKEVLQDIFLKIWEKREQIDPEKSFKAYLFRITENQITDVFRRSASDLKLRTHLISASTELYNHIEDFINFKEVSSNLKLAIDALPPQRKKIFTLCKMEGKSYEEVAELLGISTGTVNDHMVKAGRAVKKHLMTSDIFMIILISSYISQ
ncbi:RNA polymerase sigma factor [Pedobacter antarcticus]|uniref:RNA polymerase sigma factor n=1 Tax=Pedobacter antarcticus TaxID=34086 RepID=UPI001C56F46E|nr:RNA polymerase sigma-70 factor [Pedobacter antarcticus]